MPEGSEEASAEKAVRVRGEESIAKGGKRRFIGHLHAEAEALTRGRTGPACEKRFIRQVVVRSEGSSITQAS